MKKNLNIKIHLFLQHYTPQKLLSRFMGKLAESRVVWWKNLMITTFIKMFNVDMNEALQPDPKKYACFNDFFTRAINPALRPITKGPNHIVCPADGFVSEIGKLQNNSILQAKNHNYDVRELVGGDQELAKNFLNGYFATLYLAPKNYHRVHMPFAGKLQQMIYVPGKLFSVSPITVQNVPDLFALNERVINIFQTEMGLMAVILVGAMIVGSIETVWAGTIAPQKENEIRKWDYTKVDISLKAGEELGRFKMGSTVIVLFPQNHVTWTAFSPAQEVRMGQLLGLL